MRELGSRERAQPAPPGVVWESLTTPHRSGARPWLHLLDDEVEPRIVSAASPDLVVWSSLWSRRPDDVIRFDLRPGPDGGCLLRWTLLTPATEPDAGLLGHLRFRLNHLINNDLRRAYGQ